MNILVYNGKGASFAKDVMSALRKLNISFKKVDERGIFKNRLKECSTLIIPGGSPNKYAYNLEGRGYDKIINFVKRGGRYVGICAGSDLASKKFEIEEGNFTGLGLIKSTAKMEVRKILPGRLRKIKLTSRSALTRNCKKVISIWYQNGPVFKIKKDKIIATYENGNTAIIYSKCGRGSIVLFSPHPEGNLKHKIDPVKYGTINLLKNALV